MMQGPIQTAQRIARASGSGKLLVIGDHQATSLLTELLKLQVDAYLFDAIEDIPPDCYADRLVGLDQLDSSRRFETVVVLPDAWQASPDQFGLLDTLKSIFTRRLVLVLTRKENLLAPTRETAEAFEKIFAAGLAFAPDQLTFEAVAGDNEYLATFEPACPLLDETIQVDDTDDFLIRQSAGSASMLMTYAFCATRCRPGDHVIELNSPSPLGLAYVKAISVANRFKCMMPPHRAARFRKNHPLLNDILLEQCALPIPHIKDDRRHIADLVIVHVSNNELSAIPGLLKNTEQLLKPDGRAILLGSGQALSCALDLLGAVLPGEGNALLSLREMPTLLTEECFGVCNVPGNERRAYIAPFAATHELSGSAMAAIVFSANPLQAAGSLPYNHPAFGRLATQTHLVDFGRHYDNPWLYRTMVQNGERLRHEDSLLALARTVTETASEASADLGAALAVEGYQLLKQSQLDQLVPLLEKIRSYLKNEDKNIHVLRWKISLAYLAALAHASRGEHNLARSYFKYVAQVDACQFSPLLATKTVGACFWLGVHYLQRGHLAEAKKSFADGVSASVRALGSDHSRSLGSATDPLNFALQELAEVADMGSQCVSALRHADKFASVPAAFWDSVSTRRFGLANWLMHLEAENNRLAAENSQLSGALRAATKEQSC